jgi:hypothetical protein
MALGYELFAEQMVIPYCYWQLFEDMRRRR